jgi:hypothetical protein
MKWHKVGRIFAPSGERGWMRTHAAVPIAEKIDIDIYNIYFSCRDHINRSHTGFVIVNLDKPQEILDISKEPILCPGDIGEFDDSGAMATWLTEYKGCKYLYYIGWNLGVTVPFRNSIGLAIGKKDGTFSRYANGPIIDRSMNEPHFCASCCVIPGDDFWRIWYLSCTGWRVRNHKIEHRYHIKYAESDDGVSWRRNGVIAIDYAGENEYAISRPSVIKDGESWKMWYSYRGHAYRIGYAESADGINWIRRDQLAGIDVSPSGWDSEMIEYPFVFDHKNERYMLYNGNGYGKTGFGLAILEQD